MTGGGIIVSRFGITIRGGEEGGREDLFLVRTANGYKKSGWKRDTTLNESVIYRGANKGAGRLVHIL